MATGSGEINLRLSGEYAVSVIDEGHQIRNRHACRRVFLGQHQVRKSVAIQVDIRSPGCQVAYIHKRGGLEGEISMPCQQRNARVARQDVAVAIRLAGLWRLSDPACRRR